MKACNWCRKLLPTTDPRVKYCHQRCRQAAWRAQRLASLEASGDGAARFAYADPPYPGLSKKYYGREATFAGEVDHRELVERLQAGGYAGWALSTSARALRAAIARAVEEARAQSARSQARAADDEGPADEVTRARARQILRARGR